MVYLITGKAGAGKTHYGQALVKELLEEGHKVKLIDGDEFRRECKNNDFSDNGRYRNLISAAKLAQNYETKGFTVVMAFVAPRREWRNAMRQFWAKSRAIYIPGGVLWEATSYERPDEHELNYVDYH